MKPDIQIQFENKLKQLCGEEVLNSHFKPSDRLLTVCKCLYYATKQYEISIECDDSSDEESKYESIYDFYKSLSDILENYD